MAATTETIMDQLAQISTAKTNIMTQLQNKGSDITTSTPFSEYPDKIRALVVADGNAVPGEVLSAKHSLILLVVQLGQCQITELLARVLLLLKQ